MQRIFEKLNRFFRGKWRIAVLCLERGRWNVDACISSVAYLKSRNANGHHVLMKPHPDMEPFYLMADDLNMDLLNAHHRCIDGKWKPGRMVVETSPENYQVWIHCSRFLNLSEKRYWLSKLRSDPGADPHHRWGRCPGFRNRKEKHRDENNGYPLARLIWVDWKRTTHIPRVHLGKSNQNVLSPSTPGGVCHHLHSITRSNYERKDESAADFAYAIALARRGYDETVISQRILAERTDWKNHSGENRKRYYLNRTVKNALKVAGKI